MKSVFIQKENQMTRERKLLLTSNVIAAAGCLTAAVLATSIGASKMQTANAKADAKNWQDQAGRAYTELLAAKAATVGKSAGVLIPAGARIDCIMDKQVVDDHTIFKCEGGTIYPPHDY